MVCVKVIVTDGRDGRVKSARSVRRCPAREGLKSEKGRGEGREGDSRGDR